MQVTTGLCKASLPRMWLQGHQACAHCHLLRGQRRGQAGPSGSSGSHRHSVTLLGLSVIVCPFYGGLRQRWTQRGHSQGGGGRGLSCRPPQLRELRGARIQSLCTFSTVKALSSDSPLGPLWCPQTPDPASQPGENPAAGVQGTCMHAHPGDCQPSQSPREGYRFTQRAPGARRYADRGQVRPTS